jgi:hypothetical protein
VITLQQAKRILHGRALSAREQLFVLLAVHPARPSSIEQLRKRCVDAGVRKLARKNLSDILAKSNGYVAHTPDGWELQESGMLCVRELALVEVGYAACSKVDDLLLAICERFHRAVVPLTERRKGRTIIDFGNEYDVQDVFGTVLRCSYEDVRAEEWTPSYAGKAARIDFIVADIKIAIELKRARPRQEIADELTIDIARYAKRADIEKLVCFVYDPDGILRRDATQIERDLSGQHAHNGRILDVIVLIRPK